MGVFEYSKGDWLVSAAVTTAVDWIGPSCGPFEMGMKPRPVSCGAEDVVDFAVLSDPSLRPMDNVRLVLEWLLPGIASIQAFDDRWRRLIGTLSIEVILAADWLRDAAGSGNTLSLLVTFVWELNAPGKAESLDMTVCPWL
jgi:hypothetical protein